MGQQLTQFHHTAKGSFFGIIQSETPTTMQVQILHTVVGLMQIWNAGETLTIYKSLLTSYSPAAN